MRAVARLAALSVARLAVAPGRTALLALGIAIGVAMGLAIQLINRAAVGEFAASVRNASGESDLQVVGAGGGFADTLYPRIAALPEVAAASPVLEVDAAVAGVREPLRLLGLDPLRALTVDPLLFGAGAPQALRLVEPDSVALSAAAAQALGLGEGDRLRLIVGGDQVSLRVVAVLGGNALRGRAAVADIATVQWRLQRLGVLNRLDLRLSPGSDVARAITRIERELPPGVAVATTVARIGASQRLSQAYRVNLDVLALVALFTGGFLVFSAQMLETVRRRPEHALLRVIGLTRRQLVGLVLGEAAAVGAIGALAGVGLAYLLAWLALTHVGGDLGAGQFRGIRPSLALAPIATAGYWLLGIATALAGSAVPALDAARAAPAQALKAGDADAGLIRHRAPGYGAVLMLAGVLLAFLPPVSGIPLFGYLAVAALVFGAVALMPTLASWVFGRIQAPASPVVALSAAQLRAAPGQASVSLAAMLASFSLMVAMAIMVASFRTSVDRWLVGVLPADLYSRTSEGDTAWIEAEDERRLAAVEGVERAEFMRIDRLLLDPSQPAVALLARSIDVGEPDRVLPLVGEPAPPGPNGPPPVWVSEAMVDLYGHRPGQTIALPLAGALHRFRVAGVWRDYARQHGSIVMPRDVYVRITGDARATNAAFWVRPGVSAADLRDRLRRTPGAERLDFGEPGEIRRLSLAVFDRSFAVTYVLEGVAILVGLFGLATSLAAIVVSRRREFGMLRHIGMTRGAISRMVGAEGALIALLGIAAGAVLGGVLSLVLIYVVNRQSFHWSMDIHLPWALLASLAAVTLAAATLTAWLASRGATSQAAVQAVREDW